MMPARLLKFFLLFPIVLFLCAASKIDYKPSSGPIIVITSVTCVSPTSGSSTDDVYLRNSDGTVFPQGAARFKTMSAGQTWKLAKFIYPKSDGYIALFEDDTISADDEIGRFKYSLRDVSGRYTVKMTGDSADYVVVFEIRR
jgi:uncharacterized protein YigE (DUF2233 family)